MNVHFDPAKHEYRDQQGTLYPSVTTVLKLAGRISHGDASFETLEAASRKGTSIHWMLQLYDEGNLEIRKINRATWRHLRPYYLAYRKFREASRFVVTGIEEQFIHHGFGYAGTVDRIGYFENLTWPRREAAVLDLKTGSAIPAATNLQLVAYAKAKFSHPCRRIAVRLLGDGTYRVKECKMEDFATDWATYYECLRKVKSDNR